MAFAPSTKQWPRALCGTMKTHYKLMASFRPEHALKRQGCDDQVKYKRIRPKCELELRIEELAKWTSVDQRKDPQYATEAQ
eukprot:4420328-Lingulodinium_polyedra.AAC.1